MFSQMVIALCHTNRESSAALVSITSSAHSHIKKQDCMLCLPTKCNIDWRWFYTVETRQSTPEASASSAARVCVRAQMCVLSARVLMSPRLFDGKGEWGGEGRPALARPPLSVYSLCVFSGGSICLPLSFSLSLWLFVFSSHPPLLHVFSPSVHDSAV